MKILPLIITLLFLTCSGAFAESEINGAFLFTQYVTFEGDVEEVKAVDGLIYISKNVFSESEKKIINKNKLIVEHASYWGFYVRDASNVCVAYEALVKTRHNSLAYSENITRISKSIGAKYIPVHRWVDWQYSFKLEKENGILKMSSRGGRKGFGYKTERFEIQKIEGSGLHLCVEFNKRNEKF